MRRVTRHTQHQLWQILACQSAFGQDLVLPLSTIDRQDTDAANPHTRELLQSLCQSTHTGFSRQACQRDGLGPVTGAGRAQSHHIRQLSVSHPQVDALDLAHFQSRQILIRQGSGEAHAPQAIFGADHADIASAQTGEAFQGGVHFGGRGGRRQRPRALPVVTQGKQARAVAHIDALRLRGRAARLQQAQLRLRCQQGIDPARHDRDALPQGAACKTDHPLLLDAVQGDDRIAPLRRKRLLQVVLRGQQAGTQLRWADMQVHGLRGVSFPLEIERQRESARDLA